MNTLIETDVLAMVFFRYGSMSLSLDAWRQTSVSGMLTGMSFPLSVRKVMVG